MERKFGKREAGGRTGTRSPAGDFLEPSRWLLPGWGWIALASGLSAAALPPLGWGPLGFLAPIGFLLVCLPRAAPVSLKVVFVWGLLQWMGTFHFIRLPHWAGWIGWPLMGAYFAGYNVLLVAVGRRLIQRAGWSPVVAFPVVWVALEWVRCTLLTGLPIGLLGHTLYRYPFWIQTADLAGELTVSFLMVLVAAGLAQVMAVEIEGRANTPNPLARSQQRLVGAFAAFGGLGIMAVYGVWTFSQYSSTGQTAEVGSAVGDPNGLRVGLVQGAQDVQFGLSVEEMVEDARASYRTHQALTLQARRQKVDVVIWAESMFPATDVLPWSNSSGAESGDAAGHEAGQAAEASGERSADGEAVTRPTLQDVMRARQELPWQIRETTGTGPVDVYPFQHGVPLIVGLRSYDPVGDQDFNAAVQFDEHGEPAQRYFKTHLVPFGEYLPAGDWFPQLYQLAPMPRGLTPGDGVRVFEVQDRRLVPTICYESVMGGLVRQYLRQLNQPPANGSRAGRSSWDALLNLSNDGWFWGSNALDLHLASNVFRAVENRSTHLVVCNTGISAEIAANGEIVQEAAKRQAALLLATVYPRPAHWSPLWWQVGNGPWWVCTVLMIGGLWASRRQTPLVN